MASPARFGKPLIVLSAALFGCGATLGGCSAPSTTEAGVAASQPDLGAAMGQMIVNGLKSTEGCLDAVAAQVQGGRLSIIAWFEDRAAAMRWYESRTHQFLMRGLPSPPADNEPMSHIEADQPIMVIATITPAGPGEDYGLGMPIKQISIELFAPLPGGAAVNGRLSPTEFPVEHMRHMQAVRQQKAPMPADEDGGEEGDDSEG